MAETNPDSYGSATDGRSLRNTLITSGKLLKWEPLMFVLKELQRFLEISMPHWDPNNTANYLAVARMEGML